MLETRTPFEHALIDLKKKPESFLSISPTGMVPLLELDDGSVVTESVPVARRVATEFTDHANLRPSGDASSVDAFVELWTGKIEPSYYRILSADSEPQCKFAAAGFVEALAEVEDALWQRAMRAG